MGIEDIRGIRELCIYCFKGLRGFEEPLSCLELSGSGNFAGIRFLSYLPLQTSLILFTVLVVGRLSGSE